MIKMKDPKLVAQLPCISPKLLVIVADASWWAHQRSMNLIWTEFDRDESEQMDYFSKGLTDQKFGVHCCKPCRGADARPMTQNELNQQLMDYINQKYVYDPTRPALKTVVRHEGTRDHLHFQSLN